MAEPDEWDWDFEEDGKDSQAAAAPGGGLQQQEEDEDLAAQDQDLVAPEEPDGAVPEDEDLAYDWDFGSQEGAAREEPAADEAGFEEVDVEEEEEDEDLAGGGAEAERWDPEEGEDALPGGDAATAEAAFEAMNAEQSQDGEAEEALLRRLRAALAKWFSDSDFELEPFGSFVTQLGLRESEEAQGRSDLDVVLLFRGSAADTFARKEVRDRVVAPTINALGRWLPSLPGVVVKNVIRHARVPIVMFETRELSVDISVQQPWGVLNSWHLRDLCNSGWPGRLRALARMVKLWAKSKSIHTAKDGSLSSYGYSMLAASFLQGCGGLPAILPRAARADGNPYMDADEALEHVLQVQEHPHRQGRVAELLRLQHAGRLLPPGLRRPAGHTAPRRARGRQPVHGRRRGLGARARRQRRRPPGPTRRAVGAAGEVRARRALGHAGHRPAGGALPGLAGVDGVHGARLRRCW